MQSDAISVSSGISEEGSLGADQIAGRYAILESVREAKLDRARDIAALTIPSLMPYAGKSEVEALPTPYQGMGARCINNLANKLLLTLFPVSSPFFKLEVPEGIVQQLQNEKDKNIKEAIEKRMSEMENIIQSDLEVNAFRVRLFETLKQLLTTGDFLLYIPLNGSPEGYKLDKYVVKRAYSGRMLELILRQVISRAELPEIWRQQLDEAIDSSSAESGGEGSRPSKYNMYTRVYLKGRKHIEAKYINGIKLEGSEASYPEDSSAWLPLWMNGQSGEDYGSGYAEDYFGDLIALEGISRAIQEHTAIASKTFGVIRPNSQMTPRDIASVPNGGFVVGEPEDLAYPEIGKRGDMQVALQTYNNLMDLLSKAFLITQIRASERTTAAEVRLEANELETSLGGSYSLLANTLQKPLLMREMSRLKKQGLLPQVSQKDIEPKIIVGLDGLGRGTELEKLMTAIETLGLIAQAAPAIPGLDMDKSVRVVFNAVGFDPDEVLKSEEQRMMEQQQQQQQQLMGAMTDNIAKGIGNSIPKVAEGAIEDPQNIQQLASSVMPGMAQPQQPQG